MKNSIIAALLILIVVTTLQAQMNREELEHILKYFPDGICSSIAHVDDSALANSKLFTKYRTAFDEDYGSPKLNVLPPLFRDAVISRSKANKTRLVNMGKKPIEKYNGSDYLNEVKEMESKIEGEIEGRSLFNTTVGDKTFYTTLAIVAVNYRVYRFDDLDSLIKKALENGDIITTENSFYERPVYKFSFDSTTGNTFEMYAYATLDNELLVAKHLKTIQAMLDAANGLVASVMENPGYKNVLLKFNDRMTENWSIWFPSASTRIRLKKAEESGDSEQIDPLQESLACGETWVFESKTFVKNYSVYKSMNSCGFPVTKAFAHELKPFEGFDAWPKEVNDFYKEAGKFSKTSIDEENNIITITSTYDEEFLAKDVEITKITRKLRDDRRKAREEVSKKTQAQ